MKNSNDIGWDFLFFFYLLVLRSEYNILYVLYINIVLIICGYPCVYGMPSALGNPNVRI
jgi:hypothetical protein